MKVALCSLAGLFRTDHPLRHVKKSLRMLHYGAWLKQEARRGRFHYLPHEQIAEILGGVGFTSIEMKMSFAEQAYLFRCLSSRHTESV